MSWYRVVAVNEETRPLAEITIEAFDLSARAVVASVVTNRAGEALFTGLTGPQFFRPRHRRTSGTMGDKTFTGRIMIQVVGMDALCYDFVVDPDGGGSATTLAAAVASAITLAGTTGTATIWLCGDVTEGPIDIGGLGSSARIIIYAPDRTAVTITGNANEDIFEQTTSGGDTAGALEFHNIGFSIPGSDKAVLSIETASELRELIFTHCRFDNQFLMRQADSVSMGAVHLQVTDCVGDLAGFYDVAGTSSTFAPDQLTALNNHLTLDNWWDGGSGNAAPDETRIQGGRYTLGSSSGITFANLDEEQHFQDLIIDYAGTGALFTSASASNQLEDFSFQNIVIRFSHADGTFCNLGSSNSNVNDGLFIKNIFGFPGAGITPSGTFVTVDTDWLNVHVGNLLAKGFGTTYTGPAAGDDHGLLTGLGDDDHTQYALLAGRSGGQTLIGDTASGGDLILQGTAHATPGDILILSGQGFVVGHTAQIDFGAIPEFQVLGTATPDSSMGFARFENNASGPDVRFLKSRGATIGANTIVNDGDTLGRFRFQGADGGDFNTTAAEILGKVDGSPSLNDIPGSIVFRTRTAAGSLSDKMVLTNAGQLQVSTAGSGAGLLLGTEVLLARIGSNTLAVQPAVGTTLMTLNSTPVLAIGVDDTTKGLIDIYGHATGQTVGGRFRTYMSADYDGTDQFWIAGVNEDDFLINLENTSIFALKAEGQLQIPVQGSGAGILIGTDTQWYRSAANVLRTPDTLQVDGATIHTPGTQIITAVGDTIGSSSGVIEITADASYTLTSTPTVAAGTAGQRLVILNADSADSITLQDESNLAGSNLRLVGAADLVLGPLDTVELLFSAGGEWVRIGGSNN